MRYGGGAIHACVRSDRCVRRAKSPALSALVGRPSFCNRFLYFYSLLPPQPRRRLSSNAVTQLRSSTVYCSLYFFFRPSVSRFEATRHPPSSRSVSRTTFAIVSIKIVPFADNFARKPSVYLPVYARAYLAIVVIENAYSKIASCDRENRDAVAGS